MRHALLNAFDIAACFQTRKKNGLFDSFFYQVLSAHCVPKHCDFTFEMEKKRWIEYLERILIKVLTSGGNDIGKRDKHIQVHSKASHRSPKIRDDTDIEYPRREKKRRNFYAAYIELFTIWMAPFPNRNWMVFLFSNCFKHQNSRFISVFKFIYFFFRYSFTFLIYDEHLNFYLFLLSSNKCIL